jgi:hypothetical protein
METLETRQTLLKLIKFLNGQFFTVEFIKKDGTLRKMNCRTGVKKYLSKNGKTIKITRPIDNGILRVYDIKKEAYRSINLDTVKKINFNKVSYKF